MRGNLISAIKDETGTRLFSYAYRIGVGCQGGRLPAVRSRTRSACPGTTGTSGHPRRASGTGPGSGRTRGQPRGTDWSLEKKIKVVKDCKMVLYRIMWSCDYM